MEYVGVLLHHIGLGGSSRRCRCTVAFIDVKRHGFCAHRFIFLAVDVEVAEIHRRYGKVAHVLRAEGIFPRRCSAHVASIWRYVTLCLWVINLELRWEVNHWCLQILYVAGTRNGDAVGGCLIGLELGVTKFA